MSMPIYPEGGPPGQLFTDCATGESIPVFMTADFEERYRAKILAQENVVVVENPRLACYAFIPKHPDARDAFFEEHGIGHPAAMPHWKTTVYRLSDPKLLSPTIKMFLQWKTTVVLTGDWLDDCYSHGQFLGASVSYNNHRLGWGFMERLPADKNMFTMWSALLTDSCVAVACDFCDRDLSDLKALAQHILDYQCTPCEPPSSLPSSPVDDDVFVLPVPEHLAPMVSPSSLDRGMHNAEGYDYPGPSFTVLPLSLRRAIFDNDIRGSAASPIIIEDTPPGSPTAIATDPLPPMKTVLLPATTVATGPSILFEPATEPSVLFQPATSAEPSVTGAPVTPTEPSVMVGAVIPADQLVAARRVHHLCTAAQPSTTPEAEAVVSSTAASDRRARCSTEPESPRGGGRARSQRNHGPSSPMRSSPPPQYSSSPWRGSKDMLAAQFPTPMAGQATKANDKGKGKRRVSALGLVTSASPSAREPRGAQPVGTKRQRAAGDDAAKDRTVAGHARHPMEPRCRVTDAHQPMEPRSGVPDVQGQADRAKAVRKANPLARMKARPQPVPLPRPVRQSDRYLMELLTTERNIAVCEGIFAESQRYGNEQLVRDAERRLEEAKRDHQAVLDKQRKRQLESQCSDHWCQMQAMMAEAAEIELRRRARHMAQQPPQAAAATGVHPPTAGPQRASEGVTTTQAFVREPLFFPGPDDMPRPNSVKSEPSIKAEASVKAKPTVKEETKPDDVKVDTAASVPEDNAATAMVLEAQLAAQASTVAGAENTLEMAAALPNGASTSTAVLSTTEPTSVTQRTRRVITQTMPEQFVGDFCSQIRATMSAYHDCSTTEWALSLASTAVNACQGHRTLDGLTIKAWMCYLNWYIRGEAPFARRDIELDRNNWNVSKQPQKRLVITGRMADKEWVQGQDESIKGWIKRLKQSYTQLQALNSVPLLARWN